MASLYLGLDPTRCARKNLIHFPVIEIVPRKVTQEVLEPFSKLEKYSHLIFTSRSAVAIFFDLLSRYNMAIGEKTIFAVGKATKALVEERGYEAICPTDETQEGVIALIERETKGSYFWPKSSKARDLLQKYLMRYEHAQIDIYDTKIKRYKEVPSLEGIEEIIFTSPSTIEGFFAIFKGLPKDIKFTTIGRVTEKFLKSKMSSGTMTV